MANRIVGLDIGSWAVKAVAIEMQRDVEVVDYREVALQQFAGPARPGTDGSVDAEAIPAGEKPAEGDQTTSPASASTGGDGPAPGGEGDVDEQVPDDAPEGPSEWGQPTPGAGPAWTEAVAVLAREGFFEGVNRVVTSFPDDESATVHVDVPFDRPEEIEEVLEHLLRDELPMSFDDIVHDFIVVSGREEGEFEALVGYVGRERMQRFLDDCEPTGVDPAVVGVPELMLQHVADEVVDPGVDHYGVIDFGHRYTRLLIVSDGEPVVGHTIRRGGDALVEALAQNFEMSTAEARRLKHREGVVGSEATRGRRARKIAGTLEEALRPVVRDLRRSFQSAWANYGVAVDEIYICGGTSRLEGLSAFLCEEFDIRVSPLQLERGIDWQSAPAQPEATLALASALQGRMDELDSSYINLRQDDFVYRGKSSYLHTQMVRLGAVAAVLAVLLAGVLAMRYYDQRTQLQAMEREVAQQTQELFGEAVVEPADIQARLRGEMAGDRAFIPEMSAYEQMVRIVEQISDDIPVELDHFEVDIDRNLVRIIGETDDAGSVEALEDDIEQLGCLEDVTEERVEERGDGVRFELNITSRCF